jgi:hypothetical protein
MALIGGVSPGWLFPTPLPRRGGIRSRVSLQTAGGCPRSDSCLGPGVTAPNLRSRPVPGPFIGNWKSVMAIGLEIGLFMVNGPRPENAGRPPVSSSARCMASSSRIAPHDLDPASLHWVIPNLHARDELIYKQLGADIARHRLRGKCPSQDGVPCLRVCENLR